jgi:Methyltransferase domain
MTSIALKIFRRVFDIVNAVVRGKSNRGFCPICKSHTLFIEQGSWLRDFYKCVKCNSIPRHRAIVSVLNQVFPKWKEYKIHESSPSGPSSNFIKKHCAAYVPTQFFGDTPLGSSKNGVRCENLEKMTFDDSSFDLMITQDVFEHVMNPADAFKEIERILRAGPQSS